MYPGDSTAHCTYCMFTDISTVLTALPILSQALSHGKMAVVMTNKHGQKSGLKDLVMKATDWRTNMWDMTSESSHSDIFNGGPVYCLYVEQATYLTNWICMYIM